MDIAKVRSFSKRPYNTAADRHARGRLWIRYGIEISDWDWLNFIKKNVEHKGMPLRFLSGDQELRAAMIHDQKVYYVWRKGPRLVQTFLTEEQVKENDWV